ncbi:MAG: hypothetical protein IT159_12630 [Bryobacterales bacterium]|nr:hypothetical protein [Bryobacterales bacterium]
MKRLLSTLLLLAWVAVAPAHQSGGEPVFREIDAILAELSKITGLEPQKPVLRDVIGRDQVKRFLEDRIKEEVKPEELRAEELTLRKFGFVPADFDLAKTTVELLTEQAAAFYDFRKKRLYLLDSSSSSMQEVALAHELAHALADQHFNLARFIERAGKSDDGAMARLAVMEGQATWLMSEYMARKIGMSLTKSPAIAQLMSQQTAAVTGQFPVFDSAPLYLRETLLFPYTQGMLFQQTLVEKDGQAAFARVFRRPPESTRQILHPETYLAGEKPASPGLPEFRERSAYRVLAEGSIGELDHSILLRQYAGQEEAGAVAPLWRGGQYRLWEHRKQKGKTVLAYSSEWMDDGAAREFFRLYRLVLKGKSPLFELLLDQEGRLAGRASDGYFEVRLNGATVTSLEGMDAPGGTAGPVR